MFLASQLTEISSRFSAHVEDIREFLRKEKLPVPSPDAIPQLSSRLRTDQRFRADVASLMRATLYREREEIGYEDLLGILVAATAGTEQDLKSESQEAEIREMLRFLLQSRRTMFRPEPEAEEPSVAVEPEPREPVPVRVQLNAEPLLRARGTQSAAQSRKLELRSAEPAIAVVEEDRRETGDVVLPPFRTSGLFAAQAELDPPRSRSHSAWIVGLICMGLGLGLGLSFRRVVSAAETHIPLLAAVRSSSKAKAPAAVAPPVAPPQTAAGHSNLQVSQNPSPSPPPLNAGATADGITESPIGAAQTAAPPASAGTDHAIAAQPAAANQNRSTPQPNTAVASSGVPVTVVRQVVTASPASGDSDDPTVAPPSTAATRSIVHQGAAGMTAANVIYSPAPQYPAAAAAARVHGEVTVHAVVDPDGKVIYARAVSGPPALRDAAEAAVQKWRYSPLLDNGKPIAGTTVAVLDFRFAR